MRVEQMAELAGLDTIKAEDLKLMKYCQGLKPEDKLYDKLMEMDQKSWLNALLVIRRHAQNMAVKADLVDVPKSKGHVIHSMTGGGSRPSSRSPGQQKKTV